MDEATQQGLGLSVSLALVLGITLVQVLHRGRTMAQWSAGRTLVTASLILGLGVAAFVDLEALRHSIRGWSFEASVYGEAAAEKLFRLRHANETLSAMERTARGAMPLLLGAVATALVALVASVIGNSRHVLWVWGMAIVLGGVVAVRTYGDHSRAPVYEALRGIQAHYEPGLVEMIAATSDESPWKKEGARDRVGAPSSLQRRVEP